MPNKNNGFTLLELLVSLVILSIGMLGLLQAVTSAINHNMGTQLRDAAVRLADEKMAVEKSKTFNAISTTTKREVVKLDIVNGFKNYSVVKSGSSISSSTTSVQLVVSWKYKGKRFEHVISSLVSQSF